MTTYQKFKSLPMDHSAIGLEQSDSDVTYSCTPRDAHIIGWAGVDGIHYCTIPEFGEMIFAVSPMNAGDCVHPIARNFEDLLGLLLFCGDMAALEQCYAWDEEQFKAFLTDCPVTEQQKAVLDVIQREFNLEPMEDAFAYVKRLQSEFDLSQIPYPEDHAPDMNDAASEPENEWKVTFNGSFWGGEGKPGTEVPIGKHFRWGREKWYIPAAYLCDDGLFLDFCMEAEPEEVNAFIGKWDLLNESSNQYIREQQAQMERENPLNANFHSKVICNGKILHAKHSCAVVWLPASCVSDGIRQSDTAKSVLTHYGLDAAKGWGFHRSSYRLGNVAEQELYALTVRMERQREDLPSQRFTTPAVGESVTLTHPLTGDCYTLTVHEAEQQEVPEHLFSDPNTEYPNHLLAISYSLEPDITEWGFRLQDCADGDQPRRHGGQEGSATACGVDGPTAVVVGSHDPKLHAACSSLHFEPVEEVEWQAVFSEKLMEDIEITLM